MIVIDAEERPISISPSLRRTLGLGADGPPPCSLRAIMDEASAWRVHAALRYGGPGSRDPIALRLVEPGGGSRVAIAEFLPTIEGGAVLVVSLAPGPWSGNDAALLLDRSKDLAFSVRLRPALAVRYVNAASAAITGYRPRRSMRTRWASSTRSIPTTVPWSPPPSPTPDGSRPGHLPFPTPQRRVALVRALFATPVLDEEDRVAAIDGIARDVTIRHRLEEQYRLLVERSPGMVYRIRLDPDCATEYVSPACEAVTGRSPEEFHSDPWLLLRHAHPDDRHLLAACVERPANFCARPLRFRVFHPDGSVHWIEQVNVPVCDEADRLIAIEGVCRDVTEREEVEATLQHLNRRMTLLASLTRHDILNQADGSARLARTGRHGRERHRTGLVPRPLTRGGLRDSAADRVHARLSGDRPGYPDLGLRDGPGAEGG